MTTYKGLKGKTVQNYTTDPTDIEAEGQLFYNSTSGTFKTALGSYGVWSSGGSLNTARANISGAGTQTSSVAFGGITPPTNARTGATELYNGTSWTTSPGSMNTARNGPMGNSGTQSAALAFGGDPGGSPRFSAATESFNGSAWTSLASMNQGKRNTHGASGGTQTASLNFSGFQDPVGNVNYTESWNGSAWTSTSTVNTARRSGAGSGTQTSCEIYSSVISIPTSISSRNNSVSRFSDS